MMRLLRNRQTCRAEQAVTVRLNAMKCRKTG